MRVVVNLHSNLSKMFSTPGDLMEAIKRVLCSFENYKERFNTASVAVQGSGWGWLVSHAFFSKRKFNQVIPYVMISITQETKKKGFNQTTPSSAHLRKL